MTRIRRALVLSSSAAVFASIVVALAPRVSAVATRSFTIDDAASFQAGELDGTQAHSSGNVTLGASLRRLALDDVPVAYCFARGPDGSVFIGTGNEGKVYRLRGDSLAVYAETHQLLASALAVDPRGNLYVGTLPEGRIYLVNPQGQLRELVKPDATDHIWSLVWNERDQHLYAATGPEGKVFSITPAGVAEVYYDSQAAHVMTLALADDGTLYAGTSEQALVLRLRGPGRAEVVHDFPGNEITSIAVRNGTLAVAANEFTAPPAAAPTKNVDGSSNNTAAPTRARPGKGRLFRVDDTGRVERVYENEEGHFTSVQIDDEGTIYAGLGKDGRVMRFARNGSYATYLDVDERQVLAIDVLGQEPLFVTGDSAAVYRVLRGAPEDAMWTSKVLDAEFNARFGEITWRARGAIELQTRSGNTETPDGSWSDWSAPIRTAGPIRSPAARFLQIRARFTNDRDAVLHAITAYYLPQNQRASVRDVALKPPASKNDDPSPRVSTTYGLTWKVDNPDNDNLRYRLKFRAEGQTLWREMHRESEVITRTEYDWETSGVPDGYYVVQVEASDEVSNPEPLTLRATTESEPLLIDNHPPRIEGLRREGARITGRVIDGLGPIARLEYSVDGREWHVFFPLDDLLDTAEERFALPIDQLTGPHIVGVRARDAAGNVVSAELEIR